MTIVTRSRTYEVVSYESAEHGDAEEIGFTVEPVTRERTGVQLMYGDQAQGVFVTMVKSLDA